MQYSSSGNVQYDFKKAEQYLLDVYFSGKPLIDLEVRMVQYSNSAQEGTFALRQKVKQEPLTKDQCDKILKELGSPAKARTCLELLETCISFLQATGGSFVQTLDVGEKKLGDYVKATLMMDEAEFGSRIVSDAVKLKQIDALWKLLRDFTVVDPFAQVRPKYKVALDEKQAALLTAACDRIDVKTIVPLLKEFIETSLSEDYMNEDASMAETVGNLASGDTLLASLDWFVHWPEALPMKNCLDAFHLLEQHYT